MVEVDEIILQFQNEKVARLEAQVGRLYAVAVDIAVAGGAVLFFLVSYSEINGEYAVLAAEIFGFGNGAPGRRTRAHFTDGFLSLQIGVCLRAAHHQEQYE